MKKKHYCIDCLKKGIKTKISRNAKRCAFCENKRRHKLGIINKPNYIDGRTLKKYYCKEEGCDNEIDWQTAVKGQGRCRSCSSKGELSSRFGKTGIKSSGYIDGRTLKKHFCIESNCNNEIGYNTWRVGEGRCQSCSSKKHIKENGSPMSGKKHNKKTRKKMSLSSGGTGIPYENAKYPEEFFKIRPKIRKRDNYTCQLCGKIFDKHSSYLQIHHIDYDKKNCKEDNLITLCHSCNIRANYNRDYWKKIFKGEN